jgi:hypothetical protein
LRGATGTAGTEDAGVTRDARRAACGGAAGAASEARDAGSSAAGGSTRAGGADTTSGPGVTAAAPGRIAEGRIVRPKRLLTAMDTDSTFPAADALALAMMNSFGQLSLILAHMQRHQAEGNSAPGALEPPFALAELLKDVLRGLAEEHETHDIATAAQMLGSATRLIGDELFLVDLGRLQDLE